MSTQSQENTAEIPSTEDGQQDMESDLRRQRDDSPQKQGNNVSEDDECLGRLDPLPGPSSARSSSGTQSPIILLIDGELFAGRRL
jgi:hypothetical protein